MVDSPAFLERKTDKAAPESQKPKTKRCRCYQWGAESQAAGSKMIRVKRCRVRALAAAAREGQVYLALSVYKTLVKH